MSHLKIIGSGLPKSQFIFSIPSSIWSYVLIRHTNQELRYPRVIPISPAAVLQSGLFIFSQLSPLNYFYGFDICFLKEAKIAHEKSQRRDILINWYAEDTKSSVLLIRYHFFLLQTHIITYNALNLLTKRYDTYSTYK